MPVEFIADLHIHTCLSPCAELAMTPRAIVERASSLGINIIAVCDHNSIENAAVTQDLARRKGINALAGIEVNSAEEVHILGLFGDMDAALQMQTVVYEHLQPGENDEDTFGMQVVVNEADEVMDFNKRLLIGSTDLSVNALVALIHGCGGVAIASHIDREGFGIIGQLGFIPAGISFDALEISCMTPLAEARTRYRQYARVPWITSSDAHRPEDIGRRTTRLMLFHSTFEEIRLALQGVDGRGVIL